MVGIRGQEHQPHTLDGRRAEDHVACPHRLRRTAQPRDHLHPRRAFPLRQDSPRDAVMPDGQPPGRQRRLQGPRNPRRLWRDGPPRNHMPPGPAPLDRRLEPLFRRRQPRRANIDPIRYPFDPVRIAVEAQQRLRLGVVGLQIGIGHRPVHPRPVRLRALKSSSVHRISTRPKVCVRPPTCRPLIQTKGASGGVV